MESRYAETLEEQKDPVSELSDLEALSHFYGLVESYHQEQVQEQLEKTFEQVQRYKKSKRPGSRLDLLEEGADLWADICQYWDATGKYEIRDLSALTPIMAVQKDLGVDIEGVSCLEELESELDEGIDYF